MNVQDPRATVGELAIGEACIYANQEQDGVVWMREQQGSTPADQVNLVSLATGTRIEGLGIGHPCYRYPAVVGA